MKRVYLVRHGESEGNLRNEVGGKDLRLSDAGQMQASQLAGRMSSLDIEKLVSSDFVRAQQTIFPTAELKKITPEIVSAFGEILEPSSLFGLKEDSDDVLAYRKERNSNIENFDWKYENGESFADVQKRINEAKKYLEDLDEESVLVVSHAFFICLFCASILLGRDTISKDQFNIACVLQMSNVGISYLTFDDNKWRLVMHNDHAHFAE